MTMSSIRRAALVGACLLAFSSPLAAQHRARLSRDLDGHLTRGSERVDVIVRGGQAEIDELAARYNVTVRRYLRSGGAVLRVDAGQLAALAGDGTVDRLSSDADVRASADVTRETIGADQVWAGAGTLRRAFTGAGVGVAVIDSGIDLRHPALAGRVITTVDFTGGDGIDTYGHGTHIASLIAGAAGRTADTADYRGIASGAHLVNLRVLDGDGAGKASDVIEAIDWAIEHRRRFNIQVINLSLGAPVLQSYRDDPLCEAAQRAVDAGIVVVAAAGNFGITPDGKRIFGGITAPGNTPSVITVGALDTKGTAVRSDDTIAKFSSRGPTMYDHVVKPDLVAPGRNVIAAEAAGSTLAARYPERHVTDGYMSLSGSSMSAGIVSGAVALLLERRPNLGPAETRIALQLTSEFMKGEGLVVAGAGSLNALAAAELSDSPAARHLFAVGAIGATTLGGDLPTQYSRLINAFSTTKGSETIIWGQGATIVWGQSATIVWGQATTIIWGQAATIIWGQASGSDTIIWGQTGSDTIIWGQDSSDTIIWGQSSADTIIWGQGGSSDTIIWGQDGYDTIIWGQDGSDTIIWGQNGGSDTIIWGQGVSDTIIWGQDADTIIWGQ